MAAVLVGRFTPGSPEWHAARATGLGGSEIAAVLGLSPFESRFSLWHRKAGAVGPVEETPEMEWGKRLEDAVATKFFDRHPELGTEGLTSSTFHAADRPWQVGNPDRRVFGPRPDGDVDLVAVLEVKTAPYGDGWGEDGTDQVPPHVRVQAIWYGDVLEVDVAWVAVLIGGCDYREYRLTWDADEAELLRREGRRFLDELAAGIRPDIDAHPATYETCRELHPDIDPVGHDLDGRLAHRYIAARQDLRTATDAEREAKSLVLDAMGNAQRARWDGQTIARRQARGDGLPYLVAAKGIEDIDLSNPSPGAEAA